MRKRLFEIVETSPDKDILSKVHDFIIFVTIIISIIPLMYKGSNNIFRLLDLTAAYIFIVDYILRLITSDFKLKKGIKSFFFYPFTPFAIIDLLSILPSFTVMNSTFKILRILRVFKTLRLFKALKYSGDLALIVNVIRKRSEILTAVFLFAIGYIILSALIMFNVEPGTFKTFFDAVYWATTALTTIGYGDIYPVSDVGKAVSMLSSIFGIAMIALPSGIISASFMDELKNHKKE
ncbi:MAG: ion transporter [Oscillospiraceae bacterium]|nr:ion transporter [Oscillospiraceae bacterium]